MGLFRALVQSRRLRILESNYGRDHGWYVEAGGKRLAALADPRWEDMFWYSYRLEPLTGDPAELADLFSDDFWGRCDRVTFRSREFGEVAPYAFPGLGAGPQLRATGRVLLRGLYLAVTQYPWDGLLLWLRRRRKGPRHPDR